VPDEAELICERKTGLPFNELNFMTCSQYSQKTDHTFIEEKTTISTLDVLSLKNKILIFGSFQIGLFGSFLLFSISWLVFDIFKILFF
jgi:hypothetical protein